MVRWMHQILPSLLLTALFGACVAGVLQAAAIARRHEAAIERWLASAPDYVPAFILERTRKSAASLTTRYRFVFALTGAVAAFALWAIWFGPRGK
ncbi:MAG TPA: hypothetical protein VHS56_12650 [Candidatus Cybelea sp.]|jgi:hypothetical protein|nr:hypothetical protein [Candidatus Cybelea sp.]